MKQKQKAAKSVNIALGLIVIVAVIIFSPLFGYGRGFASPEQRAAAAAPAVQATSEPLPAAATPRPTPPPTPTPVVLPSAPPAPQPTPVATPRPVVPQPVQQPIQQPGEGLRVEGNALSPQGGDGVILGRGGVHSQEGLDELAGVHPLLLHAHVDGDLHPGQQAAGQTPQQEQAGDDFDADGAFAFVHGFARFLPPGARPGRGLITGRRPKGPGSRSPSSRGRRAPSGASGGYCG